MLLFDFRCILRFSFSSLFNVFLLSVFFFSSMLSALHPITKKPIILSEYQSNMTLIPDYYRGQYQLGKNIDFSLCIVILYVKTFGPYPKHLGISYCMCNFLKASLLCKFVINFFCFVAVSIALNAFLFSLRKFLFKVYISTIKK